MQRILIAWCLILLPPLSHAAPCPDFLWHYPSEMVEPELIMQARTAMEDERIEEAQDLLRSYLTDHREGVFAEGARFALASLPRQESDPDKEFLKIIDRLSDERERHTDSVYTPWALCRIGELYGEVGWYAESNTTFEEFLELYPDDPLAGGVLVGVGNNFLHGRQYLEAALVFRRVVEEPQWQRNHLEGALGLADATALSRAWKQAMYWYGVVEAEDPTLLHRSPESLYRYSLTEMKVGDPQLGISRLLILFNLHQDRDEAGHALNHIAVQLVENHHDFISLWFSTLAAARYENREPGRRAKVALARWVASYLTEQHSKEDWRNLYYRLDVLEILLSVSWDGVMEMTQPLLNAPESDVADEARLLLAQAFHAKGDLKPAINTYGHLVQMSQLDQWREKARNALTTIWTDQINVHHEQQAWVELVTFQEEHLDLQGLVPLGLPSMLILAESYQQVGLPDRSLRWYDDILSRHPQTHFREEILAKKIVLAHEADDSELVRKVAQHYEESYPRGTWKGRIAMILGTVALREQQYDLAIQHFSTILEKGKDRTPPVEALRERARAYRAAGQEEHAIKDYQQLVKQQAAEVVDHLSLADLLFDRRQYPQAAAVYEQVVRTDSVPEVVAWARFRLASTYKQMGETRKAAKLFEEIQQSDEKNAELEVTLRAAAAAVMNDLTMRKRSKNVSTNEST